jgi:hypothetical protein
MFMESLSKLQLFFISQERELSRAETIVDRIDKINRIVKAISLFYPAEPVKQELPRVEPPPAGAEGSPKERDLPRITTLNPQRELGYCKSRDL